MSETQTRFDQLMNKLRQQGLRLTPQRVALLRLLANGEGHPSASQLYDQLKAQFPTTGLGTIYKTLNLLKDLDEVLELGFSGDHNRYDGQKPDPHPHLICIRCREIIDPDASLTQSLIEEMTRQSGYEIVSHRLDFYGICPDCGGN